MMNRLKIPNNSITRHLLIAITAILITFVFWIAHYEWHEEMRLWRALGDSGYLLLFVTLILGPLGKLWPRLNYLLSWRRETGIWFAILAITHGLLIANGWANWDVARFFGYEFVPQLGKMARMEPGFGLANLIGFVAIFWIAILAFTSSDKAMRWLGASSWRWLHTGSNVVFYLVSIHTAYFLFMHYTESFHKSVPPQSIFIIPFIVMSVVVLILQITSYIKVVKSKNRRPKEKYSGSS